MDHRQVKTGQSEERKMVEGIQIIEIQDDDEKSSCTGDILEKLPEWFGNKQARDEYAEEVRGLPYYAAVNNAYKHIGFFSIKMHYQHTGEIFVCGVLPEYRNNGVGRALYQVVESQLIQRGCKYVIVKTLSDAVDFEPYARTREFYKSIGFESLVTLTEMWDEENPCLIMIKPLL